MANRASAVFAANRDAVRALVGRYGACNPRVFGSVMRGNDGAGSDVDLVVDGLEATLFDIAAMELALERLLGVAVHVVTSGGLHGALRERVLGEAEAV